MKVIPHGFQRYALQTRLLVSKGILAQRCRSKFKTLKGTSTSTKEYLGVQYEKKSDHGFPRYAPGTKMWMHAGQTDGRRRCRHYLAPRVIKTSVVP